MRSFMYKAILAAATVGAIAGGSAATAGAVTASPATHAAPAVYYHG